MLKICLNIFKYEANIVVPLLTYYSTHFTELGEQHQEGTRTVCERETGDDGQQSLHVSTEQTGQWIL